MELQNALTQDGVRAETQRDPQLQTVMQAVQTGQWKSDISDFTSFKDEISMHDGLVLTQHRLILPQSLQNRAIDIAHQSHQGTALAIDFTEPFPSDEHFTISH